MRKVRTSAACVALAFAAVLFGATHRVAAQGRGAAATASGGFQVTFDGHMRTIEFTAQKDSSNNARGQGHLFNHVPGTKLHLEVDCLQVVGSVATISGKISNTNTGAYPEEMPFWMQVIDRGEGAKAPADLTSSVRGFIGPGAACTDSVVPSTYPIEGGNI